MNWPGGGAVNSANRNHRRRSYELDGLAHRSVGWAIKMDGAILQKRLAAKSAADLVTDGMVVGLGSGSTAEIAIQIISERVKNGLQIIGVPTSQKSEGIARASGISLSTLSDHPELDLAIDGADEVELGSLDLIKGRGGALLREKIVACSSRRLHFAPIKSRGFARYSGCRGAWNVDRLT
jgi:Ribose 5-phosphate isomerase A (phosphoriboisomerase A)